MASEIEGLSEALNMLQSALDRVRDLVGDTAAEEAQAIDEGTEETEQSEDSEDEVTSSGPGTTDEEGDVSKSAAIESVRRMIGG